MLVRKSTGFWFSDNDLPIGLNFLYPFSLILQNHQNKKIKKMWWMELTFLAHLSWKFKWAFLIACCLSSSIRLKPFHIFNFFSRTSGPIWTKLGTKHLWVKGIQICSNEGPCPFPRGDNSEIVKLNWKYFKIFFSRITGPIWTKLSTKHPWVERIQVCSNAGPSPSPRGENSENVKLNWKYFKIVFSRTTGPIWTKLCTKHLWVERIKVCSNEGPRSFPRGDNNEIVKLNWKYFKIFLIFHMSISCDKTFP